MVLQRAPQTVLATYRHPVAGDWFWLDDGQCGFRSFAAVHWTTDEPDEAEQAAREERVAQRLAENAARWTGFPNPCPVCGATDEHKEAMGDAARFSPATLCPHPREPGHGTGCCCAGRSKPPWDVALPAFPAMQQYDELRRRRGEGMYTPLRDMLTPEAIAAFAGDAIKDGCKHVMTGGCPFDCFRGPCRYEEGADA